MPKPKKITSLKPHLVRALYDWLLENELTPHLLIDATAWGVQVPTEHVKEGKIVLNIESRAVREFVVNKHKISFLARFDGVARRVSVPMSSILAIYALENGLGQQFGDGELDDQHTMPILTTQTDSSKVKQSVEHSEIVSTVVSTPTKEMNAAENEEDDNDGGDDDGGGGGTKKSKAPWLRLVK